MEKLIDYLISEFQSAKDFSNDWVASTIDSNFTEFDAISAVVKPSFNDFDPSGKEQHFKKLTRYLKSYYEQSDDPSIWKEMESNEVSGKRLCLLMWYSIESALAMESDADSISCGIAAANAYLFLCCIKGAQVYTVFNPYLYQKCLDLYRELYRSMMYDTRDMTQNKKAKGKAGKLKGKAGNRTTSEDIGDASPKLDRNDVTELLEQALAALFVLFDKVALSAFPEVAVSSVRLVRDLSQIDASRSFRVNPTASIQEFQLLDGITEKSIALMHRLAEEKHSHGGELVYSHCVYPRLSFWDFAGQVVPSSSSIPSVFTKWKDAFVDFIRQRVNFGNIHEDAILIKVLENLYCRCTDRQDYRSRVAGALVQVLAILPKKAQYDFIQRVNTFSKSAKNAHRNFSCEVVPLILKSIDLFTTDGEVDRRQASTSIRPEGDITNNDNSEDEEDERVRRKVEAAKKKKLRRAIPAVERVEPLLAMYQCIVRNSIDKSSSVRGRGILHLATVLVEPLHQILFLKTANDMLHDCPAMFSFKLDRKKQNNGDDEVETNDLDESMLQIDNIILHIITNALVDDKANVRKAALTAAQAYCPLLDSDIDLDILLELMQKRCVDTSVMVRRQAAESLTAILTSSSRFRDKLEVVWLKSVLPMINDREQNAQQGAAKLIMDVIISPLLAETTKGAWSLLHRIEQEDNHRRLLLRSLFNESRENRINKNFVNVLYKKLQSNPEHDGVIWMMLAQSSIVFKLDPKFALTAWFNVNTEEENNKVRYIAMVLSSCSSLLSESDKKALIEDIVNKLKNYRVTAASISAVYLCLAKLMNAVGESAPGWTTLKEFGANMLSSCRNELRTYLQEFANQLDFTGGQTVQSIELKFVRVISTVGEVIQFSPMLINSCDTLVEALKTIMASDAVKEEPELDKFRVNSQVPTLKPTPSNTRPQTAMSSQVMSQPLSQAPSSQPIIPNHLMNTNCMLTSSVFTPKVRAYCVLVIGKFCLMDEQLAKKCVPALVRQLQINHDHVVRNNIVLVISDLCIRYTLLVDRYSPYVASCLKDKSTLVRFQTLESLTNLIKEQFIRWEGQIMYRFVSTILDEDHKIKAYAKFCLKEVLLLQFPTMFFQHFIECLIYFNNVPPSFMPGTIDEEDSKLDSSFKFSLSGSRNVGHRRTIYNFMLDTFDDKDKFTTMANICTQILRPIYSGELDIKDSRVSEMLNDAFFIMSSKAIELNMDVGKSNDDDEEEAPAQVVSAAKKMITDTFRIGIIQLIMPPLLEMREFLTERRSPLLRGLFNVLRAICKQHQGQIEEVLAGDKQLMSEILHDIRLLEKKEKAEKAAEQRRIEEALKERRRTRRSMAAAHFILNNVPSIKTDDVQMNPMCSEQPGGITEVVDEAPVCTIRNTLETDDVEMEATCSEPLDRIAEVVQQPKNIEEEVEPNVKEDIKEEEMSSLEAPGNMTPKLHSKSARRISKRLSDKRKSDERNRDDVPNCEAENIDPSATNDVVDTADAIDFVIPSKPLKRKRDNMKSNTTVKTELDPNETIIAGRAISTPKKDHINLTLAELDVSAITICEPVHRPSRSQGQPSDPPAHGSLNRVKEDEMLD